MTARGQSFVLRRHHALVAVSAYAGFVGLMIHRVLKISLWVLCSFVASLIALIAALFWRLSAGPMQVSFLTPYLEKALASPLSGRDLEVRDTVLAWDTEARDLGLRARNVTLRDRDGTVLAVLPAVGVKFSLPALLSRTVALTTVSLKEAKVTLIRDAEGVLRFGVGAGDPPQPEEHVVVGKLEQATLANLLQAVARSIDMVLSDANPGQPLTYIRALRVNDSSVKIHDHKLGVTWHIPEANLMLRQARGSLQGRLEVALALPQETARINATLTHKQSSERLNLDVAFTDLRPASFATLMPEPSDLAGLDVPFSGRVTATLDLHGTVDDVSFQLLGESGRLWHARVLAEPQPVSMIDVSGAWDRTSGALRLDHATVTLGRPDATTLDIRGTAEGRGGDIIVQGRATLKRFLLADLQQYWPVGVGDKMRVWAITNLTAGSLQRATANVVLHMAGGEISTTTISRLDGTLHYRRVLQDETAGVDARLTYNPAIQNVNLDVAFDNLRPSALAATMPVLRAVAGLDLPFNGKITLSHDLRDQFPDLRFDASSGPGQLTFPDVWSKTHGVSRLTIRGRLVGKRQALRIEAFTVTMGTPQAEGPIFAVSGTANGLGGAVTIEGQTTLQAFPIDELKHYWPKGLLVKTRKWLTENLVAGTVDEGHMDVEIGLPQGNFSATRVNRLKGTLRYQDCDVHYLRPLPPIRGISGTASFDQQGFVIQVESGTGPGLHVTGGQVNITGLNDKRDAIAIRVNIASSVQDALTLLNHPRLNLLSDFGIVPAATSGQATSEVTFAFPLHDKIGLEDVAIRARSVIKNASLQNIFLGQHVAHGQLELVLDRHGMTLTGPATFGGVSLTARWKEAFTAEAAWRTEIHAVAPRIDRVDLVRFGLEPYGMINGTLGLTLTAKIGHQGRARVEADVNLGKADLALPYTDWRKASGEPGEVQGTFEVDPRRAVQHGRLVIRAGTLDTRGQVRFNPSNRTLEFLEFRNLVIGNSHFDTVSIKQRDERLEVLLGQGALDIRPLLSANRTEGEGNREAPPPQGEGPSPQAETIKKTRLHLHAPNLERVYFGPERYLQNVAATLIHTEAGWERVDIIGQIPEVQAAPLTSSPQTLTVLYRPSPEGTYDLSVRTDDFGATLRALNLLDTITGGHLTMQGNTVEPRPDAPLKATVMVKDFTLKKAPVLGRILAATSFTGLQDLLNNDGLRFAKLSGDFTLENGRMSIPLARAHGGALGITAQGEVHLTDRALDLKGTLIPARFLNTLLGKIPVIGKILVGGKGQGLVAATYRVKENFSGPKISVNPVAALTPGFLRGIFQLFEREDDLQPLPDLKLQTDND